MRKALAILVFLTAIFFSQPSFAALRVVVMDVGQGLAILLRRGSNGVLIDSGVPHFADQLLRRIAAHGVTTLDYFFLSHLHPGHAGGYFRIREKFPEAVVIGNGHPLAARRQQFIVNLYDDALRNDPKLRVMRAGDELVWRGVTIKVLWPATFFDQDLNRHSLVLMVSYGESRALLMADADNYVERRLVEQNAVPGPVSLLVAGHHGMRKSSDARFLDAVRPRITVIPVTWSIPLYHPDDAVVARLATASWRLLRTDDDGEICLELAADSDSPSDCEF